MTSHGNLISLFCHLAVLRERTGSMLVTSHGNLITSVLPSGGVKRKRWIHVSSMDMGQMVHNYKRVVKGLASVTMKGLG